MKIANRRLRECLKKARARETTMRWSMYAILEKGGAVQAQGWNIPASDGSFMSIHPKAPDFLGLHAEIVCIRNAAVTEGCTLYIGGILTGSRRLLMTKPCDWCIQTIMDAGINKVVWHDTEGHVHSMRRRAYDVARSD